MQFGEFFTEEIINQWLSESQDAMHELNDWAEKHQTFFSNKQLSENFSRLLESKGQTVFSQYYKGMVANASADSEPDLSFDGVPLEIKVTNGEQWTGGEFSKRPSDYLLVSRNEDFTKFFVCLVHLEKSEWNSGGENFYGTNYKKKQLNEKTEKKVYRGDIYTQYWKSGKVRGVKVEKS